MDGVSPGAGNGQESLPKGVSGLALLPSLEIGAARDLDALAVDPAIVLGE